MALGKFSTSKTRANGSEGTIRPARIFTQNVPLVPSGRAEVEDEVPLGLPRSPELELPNAACP